jgi:hypothetical protein
VSAVDVIRIARAAGANLMADGSSLVLESESRPPQRVFDLLRAHKPEVLDCLREERRALVRHIANHFQSAPPGQCAHCGGDSRQADPLVVIFCGTDRADIHASCHPAWIAGQESKARAALGIEMPATPPPDVIPRGVRQAPNEIHCLPRQPSAD